MGFQLFKKFPAFYGTQRFTTAFTSARRHSLSWPSWIQSMPPHPTHPRCSLINPNLLRLGLQSGLFPSVSLTKTLYTLLLSPIRATCIANLIHLYFINRTILGEKYKSLSSSLCSFLHSPVTTSLLGPKFLDIYTGLFKMIVGVLTTCHTQCTWDRCICIFFM